MIKYEDIRVGDRIRVEWMRGDVLETETGTVVRVDKDGNPRTLSGLFIGPSFIKERINTGEQVTITLLDRPKKPLPTEVGSVIHVSECRSFKCDTLAMLDRGGHWYTPITVAGCSLHTPSDITAWEPRNVVEVSE